RSGNVFGTHWHGAFESDEFRRVFLSVVARQAGRRGFKVAPDTDFAALRERGLDLLGDMVEEHLDTDALWRLIESGPPPGLPIIPPAGARWLAGEEAHFAADRTVVDVDVLIDGAPGEPHDSRTEYLRRALAGGRSGGTAKRGGNAHDHGQ